MDGEKLQAPNTTGEATQSTMLKRQQRTIAYMSHLSGVGGRPLYTLLTFRPFPC